MAWQLILLWFSLKQNTIPHFLYNFFGNPLNDIAFLLTSLNTITAAKMFRQITSSNKINGKNKKHDRIIKKGKEIKVFEWLQITRRAWTSNLVVNSYTPNQLSYSNYLLNLVYINIFPSQRWVYPRFICSFVLHR